MVPSWVHDAVKSAVYATPPGVAVAVINFDVFKMFGTAVITVLTIALLCLQLEAAVRKRLGSAEDGNGGD